MFAESLKLKEVVLNLDLTDPEKLIFYKAL